MDRKIIRKSRHSVSCQRNYAVRRQLFLFAIGIVMTSLLSYFSQDLQLWAGQKKTLAKTHKKIEGLWSYEKLKPKGGKEFLLTGFFLFRDGYFIQQSINDGEPFDQQAGMAHAGRYKIIDNGYGLVAEIGISVMPSRKPSLSIRRNTEHQIFPQFSGDRLILTFGSGTVQTFRRIKAEKGQIYDLDKGYLGFADNYFILVTDLENGTIAGSGTFEREGTSLHLQVLRWFSVLDGQVSYLRDHTVNATFDGETLSIANGPLFYVIK